MQYEKYMTAVFIEMTFYRYVLQILHAEKSDECKNVRYFTVVCSADINSFVYRLAFEWDSAET